MFGALAICEGCCNSLCSLRSLDFCVIVTATVWRCGAVVHAFHQIFDNFGFDIFADSSVLHLPVSGSTFSQPCTRFTRNPLHSSYLTP
jgi:hypothetical protein